MLWTECSVDSDWVRDEAHFARQERLLQARLDARDVPLGFNRLQRIDLIDAPVERHANFPQLLDGVAKLVGRKPYRRGDAVPDASRNAPECVVVEQGRFRMGAPEEEERGWKYDGREAPMHEVEVAAPLGVAKHPVTRAQFLAFASATSLKEPDSIGVWSTDQKVWINKRGAHWRTPPFQQGDDHPVIGVTWHDAKAYCAWLSKLTGARYRLLSESEWEYCCRAGTRTPYFCGDMIDVRQANFDGSQLGQDPEVYRKRTTPVGAFAPNAFGLCDMAGNVWEWVEDSWHANYDGAPHDGSAWSSGDAERVVRGGSWNNYAPDLRSACRFALNPNTLNDSNGFRVARELE